MIKTIGDRESVCEKEKKVCARERESVCVCVCEGEKSVCVRERGRM